jgi:predicted nucleic acid-binding protein
LIYLDSSALLKLLFQEEESDYLQEWLTARPGVPTVTSELGKVEVLRACRRLDSTALPDARALLGRLDLVPLAGAVVEMASELEGPALRSLDALHLASALMLGADLVAFVAYDHRLLDAAAESGLETHRPMGVTGGRPPTK